MKGWSLLLVAIIAEVIGTSALKPSQGFTKLWPSLLVAAGYGIAFYMLSLTLKEIPIGIAYAVWSGAGIVLISLSGWILFQQRLDTPAIIGILLILAGVLVLNLFSKSSV